MRHSIVIALALVHAAPAAGRNPCLPAEGATAKKKLVAAARARDQGIAQALGRAKWKRLESTPLPRLATEAELTEADQQSLAVPGQTAATKDEPGDVYLSVGAFPPHAEPLFAVDAEGKVFQLVLVPERSPSGTVVLCGCEDRGGGGARKPDVVRVVRVPQGAALEGTRALSFKLRGPQIVWRQGPCAGRP
jgi:hypothetical protein